jgi:hypothetical protein
MADNTRMADKLRNAFSIELMTLAQSEVENRNALPLVPITAAADPAKDTTYEQKRDVESSVAKVLIVILAGLAIFFAVFR